MVVYKSLVLQTLKPFWSQPSKDFFLSRCFVLYANAKFYWLHLRGAKRFGSVCFIFYFIFFEFWVPLLGWWVGKTLLASQALFCLVKLSITTCSKTEKESLIFKTVTSWEVSRPDQNQDPTTTTMARFLLSNGMS